MLQVGAVLNPRKNLENHPP